MVLADGIKNASIHFAHPHISMGASVRMDLKVMRLQTGRLVRLEIDGTFAGQEFLPALQRNL